MYKSHLFCALRCYQSKLSPAIIEVFVHILKFSPAKKHKETFPLSRFLVTKSAAKVSKQDSRRPPSKPYPVSATPTNALRALVNSRGVHELVARAMRGKCVRQGSMAKIGSFATLRDFILPRVRTYHTRKPSRFVHALPPHTNTGDSVARICIFPCFYFKLFP